MSALPAVTTDHGMSPALQVAMELYEHGIESGVEALRRSVSAAVELDDVLRFGRQLAALDALRHMPFVVNTVGRMAAEGNLKAVDKLLAIVGAGAPAVSKHEYNVGNGEPLRILFSIPRPGDGDLNTAGE